MVCKNENYGTCKGFKRRMDISTSVCYCKDNYYENGTDYDCYPCNESCGRCVNAYECLECARGYYRNPKDKK